MQEMSTPTTVDAIMMVSRGTGDDGLPLAFIISLVAGSVNIKAKIKPTTLPAKEVQA